MKHREITIPTILGLLITLGGLATGLWLVNTRTALNSKASGDETPNEVRVTNITDNSLVVSWLTSKATTGFVKYSENKLAAAELVVSDDRDQGNGSSSNYFTHLVTIRGLKPTTEYKLKIGPVEQAVSTGMVLRNPPAADVIYGQVVTKNSDPADGALVYVQLPGVVPQAALTKSSGSWIVPISSARTADLTSFAAYDKQNAVVNIFIQAGPLGTTSLSAPIDDARPLSLITLGQVASPIVSTPTPVDTKSKFSDTSLTTPATTTSSSGLKIESVKPVVKGQAPAGATVNIEVNSDNQIKTTVKADSAGKFTYNLPAGLEPGEHTITFSTLVDGVVKKVTKTFVVEAAGTTATPHFAASPSAKLKKTTPTPTPTPKAVRVAYPATNDQPQSGNLTPTLLLLILGGGLIVSGSLVYRKYER